MTRLTSHLDAIGSADARIAETLTAWSNVNSGSGNLPGIERMADLATAAFGALNYDVRKLVSNPVASIDPAGREVMSPRGPMLHFSTRPNASKRIMLAGHLDTVFPETSAFQNVAKRPDGTLHGPGVADMKGGLLIMLEALKCFEASPFAADVGIDVVLNSDEEIASHASHEYMEKIATGADAGFVFEPALADGTLAGARAGSGNYDVVVRGRAAHAGREFLAGRNAIAGAARVIGALDALNGQRKDVTLNIGLVSGGVALNVVPDTAVVRLNIRARTPEDLAWIDAAIRDTIAKGVFGPDIETSLHGRIHRPAKPMTGSLQALFETVKAAGADIGQPIAWASTGGCCDGNNLSAAGLPNVDTMGVRGAYIHSDEEYAVIESFTERARLAALSMLMLASGEARWPKEVV